MSSSKRRRVSPEDEESEAQPAVVQSSPATRIPVDDTLSANLDAIPQLLIVELQKDEPADVLAALQRICKMVEANDCENDQDPAVKNWKEMKELGPIPLVVICMRKWPHQHDIQSMACDTLANMVHVAGSVGRLAITKCGGVEVVVRAITKFQSPGDVELQREAIRTLQNTFAIKDGDPKVISDGMIRFVKKLKGVELIVGMTKAFPDHVSLLHSTCGLFYNLSCFKENHDMLVKSGAVEAAAAIQKRYFNNDDLRTEAEEFLTKMFTTNSKKKS
ncbi:expressed unknown protein [Seminavis robusta]|uniref:LRRK2 ARM repeat domain-containing protein n=1 Tax=Seminavis robusta TaxID=568900 RepID=A0A9N8HCQ4_9STRA|nr:expressed unknown protein [Seminavis robusta]|eukprot:Sro312_g114520.1 n/a (275) ;mRNA; r:17755-18579